MCSVIAGYVNFKQHAKPARSTPFFSKPFGQATLDLPRCGGIPSHVIDAMYAAGNIVSSCPAVSKWKHISHMLFYLQRCAVERKSASEKIP